MTSRACSCPSFELFCAQGERSVFKKDKHAMTHELGIQIRDLRLLDPLMTSTYPSAILCRDKALVVNLEYA